MVRRVRRPEAVRRVSPAPPAPARHRVRPALLPARPHQTPRKGTECPLYCPGAIRPVSPAPPAQARHRVRPALLLARPHQTFMFFMYNIFISNVYIYENVKKNYHVNFNRVFCSQIFGDLKNE